jgi:site-specific DNA-methyltransferase (adenine-specific)
MLDLLPKDLWRNPDARFLDPVCKSGVFLREIAKRLNDGLKALIPDQQERINHIFENQIYGIAITELTSLLSRRSVYCSKAANGKYSICETFDNEQGNIRYERMQHTWHPSTGSGGKCKYCGASQEVYDRDEALETYAYNFIHTDKPEKIVNMKFDVIVGNPPYQLSDGGAQASAKPIYHKFIQQAKKLNPRYLVMITPSRWFAGGKGLDEFRDEMLKDNKIRLIHDYIRADDVFPGVEIKGGINYFLWDRDKQGLCKIFTHSEGKIISVSERPLLEEGAETFIRYNEAIPILRKVQDKKENSFSEIVSSRKPFGFASNYNDFKDKPFDDSIKIYANQRIGYIERNKITNNPEWIDKYKIYIPEAIGVGNLKTDWVKPILGLPKTCCTETYIVIGTYNKEETAKNVISYTQTKFFHLLLSLKKITQHTTNKVYSFIPMQDFSESWTDEKLYKKYGLTDEEIEFIESMIRAMEIIN